MPRAKCANLNLMQSKFPTSQDISELQTTRIASLWDVMKLCKNIWLHQEMPCESPRNCPAALKRGVGSKPLVVIQRCKVGRSTWTSMRHVSVNNNRRTWWRELPNKEQLASLPKNLPMSWTIFLEASKAFKISYQKHTAPAPPAPASSWSQLHSQSRPSSWSSLVMRLNV